MRCMVTHLLGCAPLVVMAVMRESSSSFFSFSFLTRLSMARLAKFSLSPPCLWHIRLCTMLRQASLLVGVLAMDILLLRFQPPERLARCFFFFVANEVFQSIQSRSGKAETTANYLDVILSYAGCERTQLGSINYSSIRANHKNKQTTVVISSVAQSIITELYLQYIH